MLVVGTTVYMYRYGTGVQLDLGVVAVLQLTARYRYMYMYSSKNHSTSYMFMYSCTCTGTAVLTSGWHPLDISWHPLDISWHPLDISWDLPQSTQLQILITVGGTAVYGIHPTRIMRSGDYPTVLPVNPGRLEISLFATEFHCIETSSHRNYISICLYPNIVLTIW